MKRYPITALTFLLLALALFASPERFSGGGNTSGQRRRPPATTSRQPAAGTRVDYSKFQHATKQHQAECKTCHEVPTANSAKARGFPDVADFPGHDACVRCHRQQFFKGAQPVICGDCHTKISPRDDARFAFRNPNRPRQFTIEFPHDKHQDVIASVLRPHPPAKPEFLILKASFNSPAPSAGDRKADYNNCTICHDTNLREVVAPRGGWQDAFAPKADTFKTAPTAHSECFNCHWKSQEPIKGNCAGCHKLATAPFEPATTPKRISMKFRHEGGGEKKNHVAECTACHINITKSASLRGLKPDVPITGCTECHNKAGLREDLNKELAELDKNKDFACSYCHTSDVGKREAPASHYLAAERPPIKRRESK